MGRKAGLTPEQVEEIRATDKTLKEFAVLFGVSLGTVFKAKHGLPPYGFEPDDDAPLAA